MIYIYSVLIQNQKTLESFRQYHPLFLDALSKNTIGICRWMEQGVSIDTALPDLTALINDKQIWRAIIIRVEDESCMKEFATDPLNPYDFTINREGCSVISESPVPLIRLAQMLGGVPAPDIRFENELIQEHNKAPRMIYNQVSDPEEDEAYERLTEKYSHDSNPPSEIIMVSLRKKNDKRADKIKKVWRTQKESGSSDFWKNNRYPSKCRFLFFEMDQQGPVRESADKFNLWTSIFLLATNKIEPNTLQAYKLYKLNAIINADTMASTLRRSVNRLLGARQYITESIKQDAIRLVLGENELPDYKIDVPVEFKTPREVDFRIKAASFNTVSTSIVADMNKWNTMRSSVEAGLQTVFRSLEQTLDQTADKMRNYFHYSEGEVLQLNKYQTEDFKYELSGVYNNIMELHHELPQSQTSVKKDLKAADKKVKDEILVRVTGRQVIYILAIIAALSLLSVIPAARFFVLQKTGSIWGIIIVTISFLGLPAVAGFLVLLFQKLKLGKNINEYNSSVNQTLTSLYGNSALYSKYMSTIVSHLRGHSYLNLMQQGKHSKDSSYAAKQQHIQSINQFLSYLTELSAAFYITLKLEMTGDENDIYLDTTLSPDINPFYTFENEISYQIPINTSGDMVCSPFGFIDRLQITREEIYDDDRRY